MNDNKSLRKNKWIDFAILYFIKPKTLNFILFVLISFVLRELTVIGIDENSVLKISEQIRSNYPDSFIATSIASIIEVILAKGNPTILIISILLTSIVGFLKLTDINRQINNNLKVISFFILVAFTIGFSWYNLAQLGTPKDNSIPSFVLKSSDTTPIDSDIVFLKSNYEIKIPSGVLDKMTNLGTYRRQNGTTVPLDTYKLDSNGNLRLGDIESSLSVEFDMNGVRYKLDIDNEGLNPVLSKIPTFTIKTFNIKGQILDEIPDKIEITNNKRFIISELNYLISSIDKLNGHKWSDFIFHADWFKKSSEKVLNIDSQMNNFDFTNYFFNHKEDCKLFHEELIDTNCLKQIFEKVRLNLINS